MSQHSEIQVVRCQECDAQGAWSFTVHHGTKHWYARTPGTSPGVSCTNTCSDLAFVRYCRDHALANLGVWPLGGRDGS